MEIVSSLELLVAILSQNYNLKSERLDVGVKSEKDWHLGTGLSKEKSFVMDLVSLLVVWESFE